MTQQTLSVVIPTYNGGRYIAEAIESVFRQTRLPDELVVVDDASRDDTLAIVERLAAGAPLPLRTIRLATNSGGPSRPINVGVGAATSELVAVLDQDDLYEPEVLGLAAEGLAASPESSVAFWWASNHDRPEAGPLMPEAVRQKVVAGGEWRGGYWEIAGEHLLEILLRDGVFVNGFPGFAFRRSEWAAKAGGIDERLRIGGDCDFLGWLFQRGSGLLVPMAGYRRRYHAASATVNSMQTHFETVLIVGRLLASRPGLAADVVAGGKQRIETAAYWFREGHFYDESAQLYRLLGRLGEPRLKTSLALAKLHCHRVLCSVLGRGPVHTPITRPRVVSAL